MKELTLNIESVNARITFKVSPRRGSIYSLSERSVSERKKEKEKKKENVCRRTIIRGRGSDRSRIGNRRSFRPRLMPFGHAKRR